MDARNRAEMTRLRRAASLDGTRPPHVRGAGSAPTAMADLEAHVAQMQILQRQLLQEKDFVQKENLRLRQLLRQVRPRSVASLPHGLRAEARGTSRR